MELYNKEYNHVITSDEVFFTEPDISTIYMLINFTIHGL